jgi:TolB-like protein
MTRIGSLHQQPRQRLRTLPTAAGAVLLLLIMINNCVSRPEVVYQEMSAVHDGTAPRSIAILPFTNQTDMPELGPMVREGLYGHFSPRPYQDVELSRVNRVLADNPDLATDAFTPELLHQLGARLGCDAVISGTITEFERLYMGIYSHVSVGADIAIYSTQDGTRLWSDRYVARLQDGSLPLTPLGIPLSGARTGWNLRDSQIVRAVDELTRYLADRIPGPDADAPVKADWRYELQVGAYLDHQLALEQRDILAAKGLPAAVHTETRQATVWHKVTVGPYADENKALAVRRQLEDQLGVRPFLRRLPL